jgi:DNA (cytosine-5)-methyltransferase 1
MYQPPQTLSALSLFSGAGGLDLGFHRSRLIRSLACYEYDDTFAETLRINLSKFGELSSDHVPEICVEDLSDANVLERLIERWRGVDIVFGGPPCQSFSIMGKTVNGKKLGVLDERGSLVYSFATVVENILPKAFLFENVPNIRNIDDGSLVERLRAHFERCGYKLWSGILCAADFGAYTFRKRFFIIGFRELEEIPSPTPTHSKTPQYDMFAGQTERWRCCGDLFKFLGEAIRDNGEIYNHEKTKHTTETIERFGKLKYGETDNIRKRNRLDPERPAHSIYVGGKTGKLQARSHIHPYEPRELTARECAMIQGFPLDWRFAGRQDSVLLQAANAVPVQLAEALGNYIATNLGVNSSVQMRSNKDGPINMVACA